MFGQSPFASPGTGGFVTHTLEILVMLGVALALGAVLGHLANTAIRRDRKALRGEIEALKARQDGLERDREAAEQRAGVAEGEVARLRDDLAIAAQRLAQGGDAVGEALDEVRMQQRQAAADMAALREQLAAMAPRASG